MKYVLTGVILLFVFASVIGIASAASEPFEVDSVLIKMTLTKGDLATKYFTITSAQGGQFNLEVLGIEKARLSESSFVLQAGESNKISLDIDSYGLKEGIYAGSIKISNPKKVLYVPVIIEVQSLDVFYGVNLDVAPDYSTIAKGDKLVAQIKIIDLVSGSTKNKLGASAVGIEYYVFDLNGNKIVSESESVSVESKAQYAKTISFPETIKEGSYVLGVIARYASSVGTSSYVFSVGKKPASGVFGTGLNLYFMIGIIIAILIGAIVIIVYSMKGENKLVSELERYHAQELKYQKDILLAQARVMRKKGVSPRKVRRAIAHKVKALKRKHKERVKKFQRLKKAGKTNEMRKALNNWKKEGYYTLEMNSRLGNLNTSEMKKIMDDWKAGKK